MAEQQTITYAPQWNNMTVDDVVFQTNNVLLPTVPQWCIKTSSGSFGELLLPMTLFHQLMSLRNTPSRNSSSSFLVSNGKRPLTLDFLFINWPDYNKGKYVDHPTPEVIKKELGKIAINPSYLDKTLVLKNSFLVAWRILFTFVIQVLGRNYSSTEQVNSIQHLLAYSLITGTEVDLGEIIYSDLVTKLLNKSRLKYVSYLRFISCALQVLLGFDYAQDKKIRFLPPILSNSNFSKDPSKVTDIEITAHMIAMNNRRDSVSPPPLALKPKKGKSHTVTTTLPNTGLPSTLNEGTRKSKPLPEGPATYPQDSRENKQPLDRDITSTTPDEGTTKTTPRPEGSLRDKDTGGNIPPTDMEPIHTPVVTPPFWTYSSRS
ncbi:hypothetical protein Tco_0929587 [Tanacetum coccineum]